jgi:hypothetical protein
MSLDTIAIVIMSVALISMLVLLVIQHRSRLDILEKYVRSEIEKSAILDRLEELSKENQLKNIENSDGFLKFVSDSREWAFKYIEDVQHAFVQFNDVITSELDYADKYGTLDLSSPSKESLAKVSKAYKELKKMLPEDMVK